MQNWESDIEPLVSISCITYNHENYIAEAIEGFLMQETGFPFEILIHDDCSTDNTANIIREYEKKYPNIIKPIYQEENQYSKEVRIGLTFNFPRARGEYIALCEGDDYWTDPLKLQKQVGFMEDNSDYALCYTGATVVDNNGNVLNPNKQHGDSSQNELIAGMGHAITGSAMFRKFDVNVFPGDFVINGDILLWHYLGFRGKCKYLEDIQNSVYRIHDGGTWSGRSEKSRLEESLRTYIAIRKNIILNLGSDSDVLKRHDHLYEMLFLNYFSRSVLDLNIKNYFFGVLKLRELKHVKRVRIYLVHLRNIISLKFLESNNKVG